MTQHFCLYMMSLLDTSYEYTERQYVICGEMYISHTQPGKQAPAWVRISFVREWGSQRERVA